ncbi:MAG: DsbA family protein [Chloroflexi bacterium]|nr:DsbA family protein [Chloroflexota bacterium]OJW05374.1 MAG: hypothetical protein BGO39_33810 [Chloroflexi bacterium 54-19]
MTQSQESYTDLNDNGLLDLDVYFDFTCPYSFEAAQWVKDVSELMGSDVMAVRWRFFSKAQATNDKANSGSKVWDQPDASTPGLLAFAAGGAAYEQGGEEALVKFYMALGRLYHIESMSTTDSGPIAQAWKDAGLSGEAPDGSSPLNLKKLEADHTEAVEKYKAFGTPTLVFEEHRAFWFRLKEHPTDITDGLELFQHIQRLAMGFPALEAYQVVSAEE